MKKINSNKENKKEIEPTFCYGDITERDKQIVEEIINLLEQRKDVPIQNIIEELEQKFQIKKIPILDYKESLFYSFVKDMNLSFSVQGYRETFDKNGKKIKIPHIGFSSDIDYLDDFLKKLIMKITNK
jgi:hypothetical protein